MSLSDIGRKNFTEKANLGFLDIYEEHWKDHKWYYSEAHHITLLEIGVYNGNSIRTWLDYFGPRAAIVGIDKHPAPYVHDISAAHLYTGDQADISFLGQVIEKEGPFDIIIDDGGHHWDEQQISLDFLWPHVKPGGMYIIEDLQTSNDNNWRGQLVGNTWYDPTAETLGLQANALMRGMGQDVASMHIYPRLCIMKKAV